MLRGSLQDILTYLENNDLIDKVTKICSLDICQDITPAKIERDLKIFIQKNLQYLENKNAEKSLEASLKGFKISKIFTYS